MKATIKESKLTNRDVLQHYYDLDTLKDVPNFTLNKAISRNLLALEPFNKAFKLDNMVKKSTRYKEYEVALETAYKELATPNGAKYPKTRLVNTQNGDVPFIDFDPNSDEAKEVRNKIDNEYADVIAEREEQLKAYSEWLDEPCEEEIKLTEVNEDDFPKGDGNYKPLWDALRFVTKFN